MSARPDAHRHIVQRNGGSFDDGLHFSTCAPVRRLQPKEGARSCLALLRTRDLFLGPPFVVSMVRLSGPRAVLLA